jgi:O-antigen/teichoic acid export membrane protein
MSLNAAVLTLGAESGTNQQMNRVMDNLVRVVLVWSLGLGGALLVLVPMLSLHVFQSADLVPCNRLAVMTGCFSGVTTVLLALFQRNEQPVRYRVVTICSFVANLTTGLVAVLVLRLEAFGAVLGQLVGSASGCGVALWMSGIKLGTPFESKVIRRGLGIGIPLTIYSVGGFSTDQLSRVFIERYVSASALGVYNIAFLYSTSVTFVFGAINTAWVPRFFQQGEGSISASGRYGTAVILSAIAMGGIMTLLSPLVIEVVVGRTYQGAVEFVPLLMINAILSGPIWSLLMNPLVLARRNWCIAGCALAGGAANVLLNEGLTSRYGVWGAAFSSLLSLLVLTSLVAYFSARTYPVAYGYGIIAKIGAVVATLYAVVNLLDRPGLYGLLLRLLLAMLCAGAAYGLLRRQRTG